ncbi:MAG TPA: 16S rRNA (guanine(527)-N(7))-methyltransferase RsmG [Caulobacteraceae bacterium]|nr:16S rRNA (guanine(527)-N(7))-methyltransferase RsmG [Caulobacteraceae bacterium]
MGPAQFAALAGAEDEQVADLARFLEILRDWNARMNLVGASTLDAFWSRHAWDSAQLLRLAPDALTWADLGAGAGFPGVVLAILLKGREEAMVHLVESMAKRCRFLTETAGALALPARVHNARAEDLKLKVDVVTARAVAPLTRLLGFAQPYIARGATGLFLKGQDADAEIAEARQMWRFEVDVLPSLSDPRGRILRIERLARA